MSAALETAQAEAESYRRAWLREEGLARAWKARDDFSQKALEETTMRALAAEAALLAKSAAYEALVAESLMLLHMIDGCGQDMPPEVEGQALSVRLLLVREGGDD